MHTIIQTFLLSFGFLLLTLGNVQAQEKDNVIGKKFTINSKLLGEDRDIQIYFPDNYLSSKESYPVLYILDGQRLHALGVSLSQTLTRDQDMTPDFVIVSVNNKSPERFSHFTSTKFLDFIEQELVPYVDKHYRTTDERIAFGWEFAGAYVIQSLISKPELFSGHIAASPYPLTRTWFDDKTRVEQLEQRLSTDINSHLYFSVSQYEGTVNAGVEELNALLTEKAPQSLRWKYRLIADERHISMAHATMFQGLMDYFYGYEEFYIEGLEQFEQKGGLENFYQYNKLRAKRFGFSEKPVSWSMFSIIRNAIRADDFEQFERFIKEFENTDMFTTIKLSRTLSFANYYIKNDKLDRALAMMKKIAKAHPESAKVQHQLGSIYLELNQKSLTKQHYKKAVELAEAVNDKQLERYKKSLISL